MEHLLFGIILVGEYGLDKNTAERLAEQRMNGICLARDRVARDA